MSGFFKLIEQYSTQDEPAFCGLASIAMVLNALSIDPKRPWKGSWRWFHEQLLDCCLPLNKVAQEGVVLMQVRLPCCAFAGCCLFEAATAARCAAVRRCNSRELQLQLHRLFRAGCGTAVQRSLYNSTSRGWQAGMCRMHGVEGAVCEGYAFYAQ